MFLCYKSQRSKTINLAAFHGKIKSVKKHLTSGVDVNHKDKEERTPLHEATGAGHKEIAELLINKGADVNAKISSGLTPLFLATGEGHKEVVELLIAKDADVNAKDDGGGTPLDLADGETADLLRKHGSKTGAELKAEGK